MAKNDKRLIVATLIGLAISAIALLSTFVALPGSYTRRVFFAAGCEVAVTSNDQRTFEIVNSEMKRLEAMFRPFGDSVLVRVNEAAGKSPVVVPQEFIELVTLAIDAHTMTQGVFDVSAGRVFWFWKDKIKSGAVTSVPAAKDVDALLPFTGISHIVIDTKKSTVFIDKAGVQIDLGGIAVGYMLDKTVQKLRAAGITSALIDAGGDVYALGGKDGRPWDVGVKDPDKDGVIHSYALTDEALATSGDYAQCFVVDGKRYSHLVDPKTLLPVQNGLESVTVTAANAVSADVFSTSFFIMGKDATQRFIYSAGSNMRVCAIERTEKGREMHLMGDQR
jgi:thiamine biosynthesis lipoprotein